MQCKSSDCPATAVKLVGFPWAEPVPACQEHVTLAQQLMVNLGRENELRLFDLPPEDAAPATPDKPPATPEGTRGAVLGPIVAGRLELELELERLRFKRAELEHKAAALLFDGVTAAQALIANAREQMPVLVDVIRQALGFPEFPEPTDGQNVVEGSTEPPSETGQESAGRPPSPT